MTEPLFVGVDAGGSGVRAVLANADGGVLAFRQTHPRQRLVGGVDASQLRAAWQAVLGPLAEAAARAQGQVVRVHAGLSGISIRGTREAFEATLEEVFEGATCEASSDALVAAWGALGGGGGVVVVAGTGSIALAGDGPPYPARAGGYGYLLGDEGGGFWLGREALMAALRAGDGRGPPTQLTELIRESVGLTNVRDTAVWLYAQEQPVAALAGLAPLVARAAEQRDAVALGILAQAGLLLADLAAAAAHQAWPNALPTRVEVAQCGRVWQAGGQLQASFLTRLADMLPEATAKQPRLPPVAGALLAALDQPASGARLARLQQELAGYGL